LRIDRFALTSNNISYGAFGDGMSYWSFFPTGDASTGCIPVWGFATVTESRHGALPSANGATATTRSPTRSCLQPAAVDAQRFFDARRTAASCTAVYNQYLRCSGDPLYRPGDEDVLALYRPLFTTSFLIDDFPRRQGLLRRAQGPGVERLEQDRVRPGPSAWPRGGAPRRRSRASASPRRATSSSPPGSAATTTCGPTPTSRAWPQTIPSSMST
jgi:hypothetical protein